MFMTSTRTLVILVMRASEILKSIKLKSFDFDKLLLESENELKNK